MLKNKTIYLYPCGEDSAIFSHIISSFKKEGYCKGYVYVDDQSPHTSLIALKDDIAKNELWIIHQDKALYEKLYQNAAAILPKDVIHNGHHAFAQLVTPILQKMHDSKLYDIYACSPFELDILNYTGFVVGFFAHSHHQNMSTDNLCSVYFHLCQAMSDFIKIKWSIPENAIGVSHSALTWNKHLGDIVSLLHKAGLPIVSLYATHEYPNRDTSNISIHLPCLGYFTLFFHCFAFYIDLHIPFATPSWSSTKIYVPHAYIDPIANLAMRKRPLDDSWFRKRIGLNGYRIVTSLSNFKILETKAKELGCEDELFCGGYPSLDKQIEHYESYSKTHTACCVIIAINNINNFDIIESFLNDVCVHNTQTTYVFRPYPGYKDMQSFLNFKAEFSQYPNFIYDESPNLTPAIMHESICLIGDISSLVYTYPLTTLKPAILLFKDKEFLDNTYNGVSFYAPPIHLIASSVTELKQRITSIQTTDKNTLQHKIKAYREKEVFHLGNSSKAIADFVIQKFNKQTSILTP